MRYSIDLPNDAWDIPDDTDDFDFDDEISENRTRCKEENFSIIDGMHRIQYKEDEQKSTSQRKDEYKPMTAEEILQSQRKLAEVPLVKQKTR